MEDCTDSTAVHACRGPEITREPESPQKLTFKKTLPVATSTILQSPASGPLGALTVHLKMTRRSVPTLTGGVVHSPLLDLQLAADAEFASPASAHKAAVIRAVFKVLCIIDPAWLILNQAAYCTGT